MKEYPKISIVVLNYNGLKYLQRTIPALLKIDYPAYEIIIVDNASSDKSINFLENFEGIKIVRNKKNYGCCKGKNIGIKKATGEYILLLDNDILLENRNSLKI